MWFLCIIVGISHSLTEGKCSIKFILIAFSLKYINTDELADP